MRTIPNILQNLKQLETNIRNYFVESLFNGYKYNDMQSGLFELAAKYGGHGIINPSKIFYCEYSKSQILTQEGS